MTFRLSLSALGTYNWAKQLIFSIFSGAEKEAVLKQVEELKVQLQRAERFLSGAKGHRALWQLGVRGE